jgi:hypothetical protein
MVPPEAIALERLLARRRELSNILLNVEMFDRWGPKDGPEAERIFAEGAAAQAEMSEVTAKLEALSRETWARDPELVRAWAEAHRALLESFVATYADDPARSTGCFVAREELETWREVAEGKRPYVDENCYYVSVDPERHEALFGKL